MSLISQPRSSSRVFPQPDQVAMYNVECGNENSWRKRMDSNNSIQVRNGRDLAAHILTPLHLFWILKMQLHMIIK
jgi:hypothetical protein